MEIATVIANGVKEDLKEGLTNFIEDNVRPASAGSSSNVVDADALKSYIQERLKTDTEDHYHHGIIFSEIILGLRKLV